MGALLTMLPQILSLLNNPAIAALLPLIQQLLSQMGSNAFPGVDPNKAGQAAVSLFDPEHVKWVQTALSVLGQPMEADGVLGDAAKTAVKEFQAANNLVVDGWPGPKTNDALRAALLKK